MRFRLLLPAVLVMAVAAHAGAVSAAHKRPAAEKHAAKKPRPPQVSYVEPLQPAVVKPVDLSVPQRLPER